MRVTGDANGLVSIGILGARYSSDGATFCIFYRSCHIYEWSTVCSAADPCSVKLAHLYWVHRLDVDTSVLGLVAITPFARDQCIVLVDVLAEDS